jgi:hypothetical protein
MANLNMRIAKPKALTMRLGGRLIPGPGRGIRSITIDDDNHLIITYTDGTEEDAGTLAVDASLTVAGRAADAKAAGDAIDEERTRAQGVETGLSNRFSAQYAADCNEALQSGFFLLGANTGNKPFNDYGGLLVWRSTSENQVYQFAFQNGAAARTIYGRHRYAAASWTGWTPISLVPVELTVANGQVSNKSVTAVQVGNMVHVSGYIVPTGDAYSTSTAIISLPVPPRSNTLFTGGAAATGKIYSMRISTSGNVTFYTAQTITGGPYIYFNFTYVI